MSSADHCSRANATAIRNTDTRQRYNAVPRVTRCARCKPLRGSVVGTGGGAENRPRLGGSLSSGLEVGL